MADIELVIKIPDHLYKLLKDFPSNSNETTIENVLMKAVESGTPIPDNATNERMVGKWIKSRDSYGVNHFTCPFCEHDIATKAENWDDNYCANCGAELRGAE